MWITAEQLCYFNLHVTLILKNDAHTHYYEAELSLLLNSRCVGAHSLVLSENCALFQDNTDFAYLQMYMKDAAHSDNLLKCRFMVNLGSLLQWWLLVLLAAKRLPQSTKDGKYIGSLEGRHLILHAGYKIKGD